LLGKPQSIFISLAGNAMKRVDSAVIQVDGVKAFSWLALRPVDFRLFKARRDSRDYAGCDLILKLKDVIQRSVKPISP